MSSSLGLRAGVHRKTKVYMEPSNSDWIAPRRAIFSSEIISHKNSNDGSYLKDVLGAH